MIIVPKKLTKEMIEATRGFCWTSESEAERVQMMWDAMLKAGNQVNMADKNSVYALGHKFGRQELQDNIKEVLNINECNCDQD